MTKKGKGRKKKSSGAIVVAPSATQYNGPSRLPVSSRYSAIRDEIVAEIIVINAVASSGAGVINTVFDCYSQASTAAGWSQYSVLYAEYRVLSMDIVFLPWNRYNLPTTTVAAPVYVVEDRENNTPLASLTDVSGYTSMEAHPPSSLFRKVVRMAGPGESDFISTASSPPSDDRFFIKLYSSGNTASTTFYDYVSRLMVQFRNRK